MANSEPSDSAYVLETMDILDGLEAQLLDLEQDPNPDAIDAVFRALHTIKGGGGMFGYRTMAEFVHHFEDAFDKVRDGKLSVSSQLVNLALRARDHVIAMLNCGGDGPDATALANSGAAQQLLADLKGLLGEQTVERVSEKPIKLWKITFKLAPNALLNGTRPDLLLAELASLGTAQVTLDGADVPPLEHLDPTLCHLGWTVLLNTSEPRAAIEDVFIFTDDADLEIVEVAADTLAEVARIPQETSQSGDLEENAVRRPSKEIGGDFVRVSSVKLDEILDQLGELVIAQARLSQISAESHNPTLAGLVEEVERLVTGMREVTLSVRMLPIETVFGKFRRVVRDLSAELGKDVELATSGGETEIDKSVIDRLSEPLVHMIRNSIDHGIESADGRIAAGKPAQATVWLSARQEAGDILISVRDDGAGLNTNAIRSKAIQRGLIAAEATPSDLELHQLIFAPGFSTAQTISSVSGRGVGMDAVLTTIRALRGSLDVKSHAGRGTLVTLRIPLSLAIIDGLLVRQGAANYVIPLASVDECVEFDSAEHGRESGRTMLQIREHLVPFVDLTQAFGEPTSLERSRRVVIVKSEGLRLGLVVDDILGQNQTVIKALGPFHDAVDGFAGATILGDGSVALIIDVAKLARQVAIAHGALRRAAA